MPVSNYQLITAWKQVLTLSRLEPGQNVTILTGAATHPQTLECAWIATQEMGAIVNRLDLPPVNGDQAHSRDSLAYLGITPLTGNHAAIAALTASDLVLDLMTLLFSPEQHAILATGTKILLAVEPPEVLAAWCQPRRNGSVSKLPPPASPKPGKCTFSLPRARTCAARWVNFP